MIEEARQAHQMRRQLPQMELLASRAEIFATARWNAIGVSIVWYVIVQYSERKLHVVKSSAMQHKIVNV